MSENKHTPGPWVIGRPPPNGEQTIGDKNGLMVAVATTGYGVNSEANARRIVACVNACAGITTEQLERSKSLDEFMRSMKVIEQQRDDLLSALDITLAQHDALLRDFGLCSADTIEQARAVLASVKGEQ